MKTYGQSASSNNCRIKVGIADMAVTDAGAVLTTSGLGSCLGVTMYDEPAGVAGLIHVMLPEADENPDNPAKFTDTGIDLLLSEMVDSGASQTDVVAKVAGGSRMFDFSSQGSSIGERNVEMARETLEYLGVPIIDEDVGGEHGRSLKFEGDTGTLFVKSAETGTITM